MRAITLAATVAAAGLALPAMAQTRVAQFDINNLKFQARDNAGAPVPFGGVSHTGSITMADDVGITELLSVAMQTGGGPFVPDPLFNGILTSASVTINLLNGMVTGGALSFDVNLGPANGGDRYSAVIGAGGFVSPFVGGGFKIEALSTTGAFSDPNFAGVAIPDFFSAQSTPPFLLGAFLAFKVNPDGSGSGYNDMDVFVQNIPTPGSLGLLALSGVLATRRKRK
ncbi:MAG: hypothetical protein JNM80_03565 [Phycisphaerae bacterium]|nr:hypothetical protein [Phycisphaerae bacterium]